MQTVLSHDGGEELTAILRSERDRFRGSLSDERVRERLAA